MHIYLLRVNAKQGSYVRHARSHYVADINDSTVADLGEWIIRIDIIPLAPSNRGTPRDSGKDT